MKYRSCLGTEINCEVVKQLDSEKFILLRAINIQIFDFDLNNRYLSRNPRFLHEQHAI